MERILNKETKNKIGEQVKVCGWVQVIRSHGKIVFIDLRDRSGIIQVVFIPGSNAYEKIKEVRSEWVVELIAKVNERPEKLKNANLETGNIELEAIELNILAEALPLPFDFMSDNTNLLLPTLLDNRPLTIRNEKNKAVFKIGSEVIDSFRKTLKELDFIEFQSPNIVPTVAEGGADIFHIKYYDYDAYLAQSPQLYKQIMLGAFERVFTIARVFRAEPSVTTRHMSEFTSLDAEMSFINSWEDVMDTCEKIIRNMFSDIWQNCPREVKILKAVEPLCGAKIPRIKMRQAQQIIFDRTGRDNRNEPDLEPEDEKEICQWAKENHNSDFIFITHYPVKKRPFYTFADPDDPEYTMSFDILFRGLEIVTGGRRINKYNDLIANIKEWGNDEKLFSFYLQAFEYGMPPEGGFAFGYERILKQLLDLSNVREAVPFPRDMERIDQRLSVIQPHNTKKIEKEDE